MLVIMWTIMVAISVKNYGQSTEIIFGAKNWARDHPLFGIPEHHPIPKKIFSSPMNFQLKLHFPVSHTNWLQKGNIIHKARHYRT